LPAVLQAVNERADVLSWLFLQSVSSDHLHFFLLCNQTR